jgi:hypothetical protein
MLLCELHPLWTSSTISAASEKPLRPRLLDSRRWKRLAVPAFIHGLVQALMEETPRLARSWQMPSGSGSHGIQMLVSAEVTIALLMLLLRLLALIPVSIALTLIEASPLPKAQVVVTPSPIKQREMTIVEVFLDFSAPLSITTVFCKGGIFHLYQVLWLVELHIKKCLVQIGAEMLSSFLFSIFMWFDG